MARADTTRPTRPSRLQANGCGSRVRVVRGEPKSRSRFQDCFRMTAVAARAVMSLATCCLGEDRREWALAMQGEFEVAAEKGEPLAFAAGCLIAAWGEMPKHEEGRLVLANYTLALGLLIPM